VATPSGSTLANKRWVQVAILVALVLAGWWVQQQSGSDDQAAGPSARPSSSATSTGGESRSPSDQPTDPESGLPFVEEADLPPEALDTLALIDQGGPYPYDEDDGTFGNFEGILPDQPRGYYREYTVETPGLGHRGALRIVTGDGGEYYWTDDHYQSFERIKR